MFNDNDIQYISTFNSNVRRGFSRNLIGFEPILRKLAELSSLEDTGTAYPPYNIERLDDSHYQLTLAVAGFNINDIDITVDNNRLTISGNAADRIADKIFVHKGIAERNFVRKFILADHVQITNASLTNGLLVIDFVHNIPEELKPRKIQIASQAIPATIIDSSAEKVQ